MISIPVDRLPADPLVWDRVLQEYFAFDLLPQWHRDGNAISVTLVPPPSAAFYVDASLADGLRWWSESIEVTDIPLALREVPGGHLFMNDAWTLLAWSKWLRRRVDDGRAPGAVTVLHVDDHEDMMSPRLIVDGEQMRNALTGDAVDVSTPETVERAIATGGIGMGSFIAPFLLQLRALHLRHLRARGDDVEAVAIGPSFEADNLLRPGAARLAIDRSAGPGAAGTYSRWTDPTAWASDDSDRPILLHIDMDYFNNRYDGDSDWQQQMPRHDPSEQCVNGMVDELFHALATSGAGNRVEDVAIGISPGFFPGELWASAIERVLSHLPELAAGRP